MCIRVKHPGMFQLKRLDHESRGATWAIRHDIAHRGVLERGQKLIRAVQQGLRIGVASTEATVAIRRFLSGRCMPSPLMMYMVSAC
jgi:hypothetical protein